MGLQLDAERFKWIPNSLNYELYGSSYDASKLTQHFEKKQSSLGDIEFYKIDILSYT